MNVHAEKLRAINIEHIHSNLGTKQWCRWN